MIFSHVLYQLSYLAQTKNPPEPGRRGRESAAKDRLYRLPAPARTGGLHVSVTVHSIGFATLAPDPPLRGKRRPAAALLTIAGAGFEPATFGL